MRSRARPWVILALVACVWLGTLRTAQACSCAFLGDAVEQASSADVVFVGVAIDVDEPWALRETSRESFGRLSFMLADIKGDTVRTTFRVEQAWKGVDTDQIVVDSGEGVCCNCSLGIIAQPGERLLIAAHVDDDGVAHVGFCRPPWPAEQAEAMVAAFGPPQRLFPPRRRAFTWQAGMVPGLLGLLGLVAGVGLAARAVARRRS